MRRFINILFLLLAAAAEAKAQKSFELPVWQSGECVDADCVDARLYCYLPEVANGKAMVICPGGAYEFLAMDHEGHQFAPLLNKEGMAVFVLKYRMPKGRHEVPFADVAQAMRIVRAHAKEWGIKKVGIMGSSAGGHLASTLATHYADSITRPDFQVLLYPVVTMNEKYTHKGSRDNLLGKNQTQELVDKYSNELHVPDNAPEAFIVLSSADKVVVPYNSLQYAQALINKNIKTDLHIYEGGYHGFGYNTSYTEHKQWINELLYWLRKR